MKIYECTLKDPANCMHSFRVRDVEEGSEEQGRVCSGGKEGLVCDYTREIGEI